MHHICQYNYPLLVFHITWNKNTMFMWNTIKCLLFSSSCVSFYIRVDCMNEWSVCFMTTRSYATLRAADLDWIIGTEYSPGRYILGCSQRLALCLRHSAQTDMLFCTSFVHLCTFSWLHCTFSLLCCTFHLLFAYFFVLFQYFSNTLLYFFITFSVLFRFLVVFFAKSKLYF